MGSGVSTVCGSKRSVLIANSVRKLPTIREDDIDSDIDVEAELEIKPTSGKLHQAESRDSGIGENDVPNGYLFQRQNLSANLRNSSDSSPEKSREHENNKQNEQTTRVSRPHSCRLGHRGHRGHSESVGSSRKAELSDSQIRRLVRSAKGDPLVSNAENIRDELSDDTLSLNSVSSLSPDRRTNARPKSARRRLNKRNRNNKSEGKNSARLISDLDSSTDTEISDTDMLSIPDETGAFNRSKDNTPRRKGWVRNEDFTDVMISSSVTPRVGAPTGMYRINLEDLVTFVTQAVERLKSLSHCTPADYENVMKGLRYQLVAMAMGYMCQQSTPRLEVKGEQTDIFSEEEWKVQIRLRTEDEEIIETSERVLAQRLAAKGKTLQRQDIAILLAEHLKTIEKLQKVQEAGKLRGSFDSPRPDHYTARETLSEGRALLPRRPVSARKLRKLNSGNCESSNGTETISELPPVGKSKGTNSRHHNIRNKPKAVPVTKLNNAEITTGVVSPESSPDACNRKSQNESGIDSETEETEVHSIEEEDILLFAELIEAFRLLWKTLTVSVVGDLLREYRKREAILIQSVIEHAQKQSTFTKKTVQEKLPVLGVENDKKETTSQLQMGQQHSSSTHVRKSEQGIKKLDEEFLNHFDEKRDSETFTVDAFIDALNEHMKKTRLIRVQSFNIREDGVDWNDNQRSNSFTGFGNSVNQNSNSQPSILKRQHSFSGAMTRQSSFAGSSRQNSFLRTLPGSRQNSYCRTRSRGSTGSSYTYSTTSSGISSGNHSELSDSSGSGAKSSLSRESSYGLLTEFADIEEKDEDIKTARENNPVSRNSNDSLRPPSGRRSNGPRATSGQLRDRDKRRGQTQVHGLGVASADTPHTPLRKIEEDALPNVEGMESKVMVRSRPDSGIAVSTSSASYSSSEMHKERDLDVDDHYHTTSCQEMLDHVAKVLPEQHNDLKSLVAAVTKGLNSVHSKAQALYCWLTSQKVANFEKCSKKSSSPPGRLKHIHEKKSTYWSMYMDMLKVAGVKCERVDGYVKSADYLPGNTVQTQKFQHSWVAVCMDGHYRLVDPQYGALGDKFVQEHYFATSPDELLLSHFPKDKKWLLMNQPANIEGFEGTLKTWPAMFHFNIRPLNMKSVIRTYDGKLSITVLLQNVAVNPQLEYAGPGPEIDMDTLEEKIDHEIRDVDNAETYHVTLPQEGNYYFTVYAHVLEDCMDVPVFQYRIEYVDELL
ncbi:uncharacterized protein LOC123530427 isoform X3 [Mercenaria mercenaria]|uniref:uncharacterized protein LOC123530427 isoform X3 n=1 Tax=Mercenaria mercenaria TaxID=6596 RepID=UPI00234E66B8|nr:uncharacterized protein LOC123530427 isoform X3 [Mercenaria mercenaria]